MTKYYLFKISNNGQVGRVPEHLQEYEAATLKETIGLWAMIVTGLVVWAFVLGWIFEAIYNTIF